jgi:hypothetical protein
MVVRSMFGSMLLVAVVGGACGGVSPRFSAAQPVAVIVDRPDRPVLHRGGPGALSAAADATMVVIPKSRSIAGSTPEERQLAADDWAAGAGADASRARRVVRARGAATDRRAADASASI